MDRYICKLRLRCAHADDAQRGRLLLEESLRTASFGDEGQLVIVRRLDLGKLSPHSSAPTWSRRIEDTYRRSHPMPVRFDDPTASHADAVAFAHCYEPWLVLAERSATNRSCHEWFWRLAVPEWRMEDSTEDTLRLCFRVLAREGGLRLTLVLAARLAAQFELFMLLRALQVEDLAAIRAEIGETAPRAIDKTNDAERDEMSLPPAESAIAKVWGANDVRAAWLAVIQRSRLFTIAEHRPSVLRSTPTVVEQVTLNWTGSGKAAAAAARRRPDQVMSDDPRESLDDPSFRIATWLPDRTYTTAGGLFFVIPLLLRARFPTYLATLSPEAREVVPWQFFKLALQHSRTPDSDPLFAALRDLPPPKVQLGKWLLVTHRASLHITGLTLRELVTRPGLVALSTTHLDVFFRIKDADLRIRRAALDLDPGWIPWLGRAIAFHFNRSETP